MKLASIRHEGRNRVVVATADLQGLHRLDDIYEAGGLGEAPASVRELLARGRDELDRIRVALSDAPALPVLPADQVEWLPPVPDASLVLGVAMNNRRLNDTAHVAPAGPMFFVKPQKSLVGHGAAIEIADDYGFTFPELELGVIIGSRARHVSEAEALDHVAGYTIVNDVTSQGLKLGDSIAVDLSAEDRRTTPGYNNYFSWRRLHGEDDSTIYFTYHARSKGADTFGPMGPYLTTADEVPDPDKLAVRGYADGDLFAEDSTANYTYPVARIVSWASRYFTLDAGDVIFCGTAAKGTEQYPRAHHNIDMSAVTPVIDVEIEGLGRLTNRVVHTTHPGTQQ
jgi:2-keto-4-pentenoate hydratase/2-oxohepta-3-ene-1,7-dioic acid hydratase in catechol pathway